MREEKEESVVSKSDGDREREAWRGQETWGPTPMGSVPRRRSLGAGAAATRVSLTPTTTTTTQVSAPEPTYWTPRSI